MEDPRITDVDLGRLDLSFADVLEPRLQLPHHEDGRQEVKIPPHRRVRDAEGACELGAVPDLSMPVREHRPEAAERRRRDGAPEFREVPRQKRADEPVAPAAACGFRSRQERAREPTPQPEPFQVVHIGEVEAIEFVERDASGERLRRLTQEFGRSAPQYEEAGLRAGTVREDAQELEDVGQAVDFVQNHETLERPQFQPGIVQPREIGGILEVEPGHGLSEVRRPPAAGPA